MKFSHLYKVYDLYVIHKFPQRNLSIEIKASVNNFLYDFSIRDSHIFSLMCISLMQIFTQFDIRLKIFIIKIYMNGLGRTYLVLLLI